MHNVKLTNVQEKQEQNLNVFGASGFLIKVLAFSELWLHEQSEVAQDKLRLCTNTLTDTYIYIYLYVRIILLMLISIIIIYAH